METVYRFWADLSGANGTAGAYAATYKAFAAAGLSALPFSLLINAPFGRFSQAGSHLTINANLGWWIMEIVSPITFLISLTAKPLSGMKSLGNPVEINQRIARFQSLSTPTQILALLFCIHYANRSTISVLRQNTKRSPMHVIVMLSAIFWNLANGSLVGTWLAGLTESSRKHGAVPQEALSSPFFWICIAVWAAGFAGNVYHDDILNDLRKPGKDGKKPPRYSIPKGALYSFPFGGVSFPAYFCEWAEWIGFAMACSAFGPPPALPTSAIADIRSAGSVAAVFQYFWEFVLRLSSRLLPQSTLTEKSPLLSAATYLTPPWMFLYNEIFAMLPRAIAGQRWYREKFGAQFPKDRKIVIPGIF